jgi:hypothetical protein
MAADTRTPAQIQAEIQAERAQLKTSVGELEASAKQTGRLAGTALAGLSGLLVIARLIARRRK